MDLERDRELSGIESYNKFLWMIHMMDVHRLPSMQD